jgi:uncharacterized protein YdhG (YjbR/CyaY superfamily)
MGTVDDYLSSLPEPERDAYQRILAIAVSIAPSAEQGVSYGMAALRYGGKPLLGFKSAKNHLAVFPFSPQVIERTAELLAGFELSKGTVRFTVARPLPEEAVRRLVAERVAEIDG